MMTRQEWIADQTQRFGQVVDRVRQKFGPDSVRTNIFRDNCRMIVSVENLYPVLEFLKADGFDQLTELGGADYLNYPDAKDRFGVWYILLNMTTGQRLIVKVFVNDPDPTLPSVFTLWKGADWMEREVYDMYGIRFEGHPDLRRILLPEEFTAHPLRKDYPLRGRGERHNFDHLTRAES